MAGKKNKANKRKKAMTAGGPKPPLTFRPIQNMRVNCLFRHERTISEAAAGAGGLQWYRINGLQDPDQSGVGTAALGFNNYAAMFLMYRVVAMRIKVIGSAVATSGNALGVVTLMPNPSNVTAPADPALWGGEYMATQTPVVTGNTGGKNVFTLDRTFYPWQVLRIPKSTYMNDLDYASLVTTLPTKQLYVMLGINTVGSGVTGTISCAVTISYETEFFEPSLLTV